MATRQLLVLQTRTLVAEHQRHLLTAGSGGQHLRGRFARRYLRQVHAASSRRQAQRQTAAGETFDQCVMDAGIRQYVVRTGRQGVRLRVGKARWRYQLQPLEAHGADRPRGAADIARMRGTHQHKADTGGEIVGRSHVQQLAKSGRLG